MVNGRIIPNDAGLLIEARSFVSVTLTIKGQILSPMGYKKLLGTGVLDQTEIKPFVTSILTNSDGSVAIKTPFPRVPAGFLMSLHVFSGSTTLVRRGDCFVNISLIQGTDALATQVDIWETLIQGYIANDVYLSYPSQLGIPFEGGKAGIFTGTSPGAGSSYSFQVPSYRRFKFYSMRFRLTTNAAVATRLVNFSYLSNAGGNIPLMVHAFDTQIASLGRFYTFCPDVDNRATVGAVNQIVTQVPGLTLAAGEQININVDNMNAGDLIDSIVLEGELFYESKLTTGSNPGGGGGKGAS